jgi:hypothetical protein
MDERPRRGLGAGLDDDLDERGAVRGERFLENREQLLRRLHASRGDAEAFGEAHEVGV